MPSCVDDQTGSAATGSKTPHQPGLSADAKPVHIEAGFFLYADVRGR
jgi:hypothetical protein